MLSKTLIVNQTVTGPGIYGDGTVNNPKPLSLGDADVAQGTAQVSIVGGTATVRLFGRASPSVPWGLVFIAITATGLYTIPIVAEMYADVSAISGATVNAAINYPV